jgi:hypothetical protein
MVPPLSYSFSLTGAPSKILKDENFEGLSATEATGVIEKLKF